jgi:8-oxo-dGTP pyrophosphatase MutT (NUDIX family)
VNEDVTPVSVRTISCFDLKLQPWDWPFALERRAEIDAHFAAAHSAKAQLWNGRVLLARSPRLDGDCFMAEYFETDFASFLAWRDWGHPDKDVFNGFGMGALRGSDGWFVLGEMAAHTANTGRIYFPSGTPDPADLRGDTVDIAGSVAREVEEETGLGPADYCAADQWYCVQTGQSIALMRLLDVDMLAEALRRRIEQNLKLQPEPELSAIHLVRDRRDFTAAMPLFVTAFIGAMTEAKD